MLLFIHIILQIIGVAIMTILIIFLLLLTGEVQGRLSCLLSPGEVQIVKRKLNSMQNKHDQLEVEVLDLRRYKSEIELLKKEADNITQENKNLMKKHHSLELKLTRFSDNDKQLQETSLELKECKELKGLLEVEVLDLKRMKSVCELLKKEADNITQENKNLMKERHSLELKLTRFSDNDKQFQETSLELKECEKVKSQKEKAIVALEKDKKALANQLTDERSNHKKLKAGYRVLQENCDALNSHYFKEQVDKARLEERYNMIVSVIILIVILVISICVLGKCRSDTSNSGSRTYITYHN